MTIKIFPKPVAKFIVPEGLDKVDSSIGCSTSLPAYIAWRAGTLCRRQLYLLSGPVFFNTFWSFELFKDNFTKLRALPFFLSSFKIKTNQRWTKLFIVSLLMFYDPPPPLRCMSVLWEICNVLHFQLDVKSCRLFKQVTCMPFKGTKGKVACAMNALVINKSFAKKPFYAHSSMYNS